MLLVGEEQLPLVADGAVGQVVLMGPPYEDWIAASPAHDSDVAVRSTDPVLQLYSSGTTGRPKGAVITNANLELTARMAGTTWRMGPESVNMVPSPLFHIGGAGYGLTAMSQGGHTVVMREADPERAARDDRAPPRHPRLPRPRRRAVAARPPGAWRDTDLSQPADRRATAPPR